MSKVLALIHSFFYIIFSQARKYNNEIRSRDIAIFIMSIYLSVIGMIVLFFFENYFCKDLLRKSYWEYILMVMTILNYFVSFFYFTYKGKFYFIIESFSDNQNITHFEEKVFIAFNIALVLILIIVSISL